MKTLKKTLKIAGIIVISIILFMILSVAIAKIFEDDLAAIAMEKLESEIDAPMSIGKVSLVPLFSFPSLSAEINELYIGEPKSTSKDTLFFIHSFKVGLNSWDLISGVYTVDKLEISGLDFEYTINKKGKANIDFIIESFTDDTESNTDENTSDNLDLNAQKIKLENIQIKYHNSITDLGTRIKIPEIDINVNSFNNSLKGKALGSLTLNQIKLADTKLDLMKSCDVNFDLDFEDSDLMIHQLALNSEGFAIKVDGSVSNKNSIGINTNIELNSLDLNVLKKYAPDEYINSFSNSDLPILEPIYIHLIADYNNDNINIIKLTLQSKGIDLGVKGVFDYQDTISVNTTIQPLTLDLNHLTNYIPSDYLNQIGFLNIGGIVDMTASINGSLTDSLIPVVDAQLNSNNIRIQSIDYPQVDTLKLKASINTGQKMDMSEASIQIYNHELISPLSHIQMNGSFSDFQNPKYHINSISNLDMSEFENLIPDDFAKNMQGNIFAEVNTSGIITENYTMEFIDEVMQSSTVSLQFKEAKAQLFDTIPIDNFSAQINYTPNESQTIEIQIDQVNLKSEEYHINLHNTSFATTLYGKLSELSQMGVIIDSFNIQNGDSKISASGEINNFVKPEFDITTNITVLLDELMPFVPDSMVNNMSGSASAHIKSYGKIDPDSIDTQVMPIIFENSCFELKLDNLALEFPDSILDMDSIFAQIELQNDTLSINHLSSKYNGLKMGMDSSKIHNIYKAVLLNQEEELYVESYINVGDFIFDDFKHLLNLDNSEPDVPIEGSNTEENQNWTFLIHGSASVNSIIVDSLVFEDYKINSMHIHDMSTLFKLCDSSYILDQFKFNVFEGEMNNSVHYKVRKDGTQSVSTHNVIKDMNMRTLLRDLNNFNMDSLITYENITGLLSIDLNTFVPIQDSIRIDKMMISGDISLAKGGVYDFAPAQEVSKFTSIKELDNIQFKTLRSNIFMFKNKLYVPRTDIVSNAIDIAAFGMQSLDGDSEYHMEMHLSNILFGKSKKRNKKQNESGDEVDKKSLKKSSRKIRYAVTDGKTKVGLDSKEKRDKMMNKIRVQQKMLNFIFFPKNIHYNTNVE